LRPMKAGIRVIGIDDAPFSKRSDRRVLVIGVVSRPDRVEGVLSTSIERDGDDSTQKLIKMIGKSRFAPITKAIFLQSAMLGGFNVVDIAQLSKRIGIPVIAITRKQPGARDVAGALRKLGMAHKLKLLRPPVKCGRLWVQLAGIDKTEAEKLIAKFATKSNLPEPVRLAHLIATGMAKGQSRGRA